MIKTLKIVTITILGSIIFFSCGDSVPTDYIPRNIVEAYLVVDEPISGLRLMRSLPVTDTFELSKALISDAEVKIIQGEQEFQLEFRGVETGDPGYYYPDTSYKVLSQEKYELEINLSDGSKITAETFTPAPTGWIKRAPDKIYYPKDTLKLPANDTLKIEWDSIPGFNVYGLSIRCLDTLEYGKYLDPPRPDEKNRRILKPWSDDDDFYELARWYPIPNNKTPVVWSAFKYYGLHELSIYVPDYNFLRWYLQNATRGAADPLLNSVHGNGFGCFGSVAVIRDTSFLVKNRP